MSTAHMKAMISTETPMLGSLHPMVGASGQRLTNNRLKSEDIPCVAATHEVESSQQDQ